MKKTAKRILSTMLAAVMILTAIPFSGIDFGAIFASKASAKTIEDCKVGDIITFGSYPQSRVTDEATLSAINPIVKNWVSYGYYSGSGSLSDGNMKPSDYMKYCDISYNGSKYRAVTFSSYRPYWTGYTSSTSYTYQDDNGYYTGNVYYFKYEPLKWRVLDPSDGFVMCATAIDAQAYNNYIIYSYSNSEYYGNSAKTYYASDWANSSIRAWLNNDFYNTAFTSSEKSQIGTTYNENKSIYDSKYDSANTSDKIFLLSYNEVLNSKYGFSSDYSTNDAARQLKSTDYAKCQGCDSSTSTSYYGNSWWRLRSPYYSYGAAGVNFYGYAYSDGVIVVTPDGGIVPAFKFNPKSTIYNLSFTQTHVVSDYDSKNAEYAKKYLSGAGTATAAIIPGQNENMIPQGMAYYPAKNWILVSSYDKSEKHSSVIFALDKDTGTAVAQFNLKEKKDGEIVDWKPHAGGIGVSDNNLYITCGKGIGYFPLSEFDVPNGTVKDIVRAGSARMAELGETNAAYVDVSNGMLWAGNFFTKYPDGLLASLILPALPGTVELAEKLGILPDAWDTPASKDYNSVVLGYKLTGNSSTDEWNNLKAKINNSDYNIGLPDGVDNIQGVTFKKLSSDTYKMYLSQTADASFSAYITTTTVKLNKKKIAPEKDTFNYYENLPGAENIIFINDDIYCVYESGALSHYNSIVNKAVWNETVKNCTDVIWKVSEKDLLSIPTLNSAWFSKNAYSGYNHELAKFCADFDTLGYSYNSAEVNYYLKQAGFSSPSSNMSAGRDEVNYFIANKDINVNGSNKKLVFVGCIGSYKDQWFSNFDPNGKERVTSYAGTAEKGNVHLGFADARDFVYSKLNNYLNDNGIDRSNAVILLTGHSRGAATANLLGAKLIDNEASFGVSKNNIYTYTFATPNTVKSNICLQKHSSIINIVNPEDFVTKVLPSDWGFSRYGTTYTLPSKTNEYAGNYNAYLKQVQTYTTLHGSKEKYKPYESGEKSVYKIVKSMTGSVKNLDQYYNKKDLVSRSTLFDYFKVLCPFVAGGEDWTNYALMVGSLGLNFTVKQDFTEFFLGHQVIRNDFEQSHAMENYDAFLHCLSSSQLTQHRAGYKNTVNCPVDIEIYDKATGELVGRIVDNVVDEEIAAKENSVVMDVEGDSKSFWLPSNGDYEVKLIGNDEGTMDYTVATIDSDIGETERVNFFDVDITDGLTMTGEFEDEEFVLEDYTLEYDNSDILEPTEQTEEAEEFEINISTEGNGTATESMTATSGDYVTANAEPNEGYNFIGWYKDDKLVSEESTYSFVAKSDVNLVAKFEGNKYIAKLMVDGRLYKEIEYNEGQKSISLPEVPKKDGYTGAWESYSLTNGGTTINAVYTPATYIATLKVDGKVYKEISYTYGQKSISLPAVPEKAGYTGAWESYSLGIGGVTINAVYTPVDNTKIKSVSLGDDFGMDYKATKKLSPAIGIVPGASYTVEYTSSDNSVATVDQNGNVYGANDWIKKTATITCTVTDEYGNKVSDTANVTVGYAWWQWIIGTILFGFIWY